MEHNALDILSLPQEVSELIFSFLSAVDLLTLSMTTVGIRTKLANQRIWRVSLSDINILAYQVQEACIRTFDLEFIDEKSNWHHLTTKYCNINYNIRQARALVQSCVLSVTENTERQYTRESYALDPNHLIVNWRRLFKEGDDQEDYNDHAVIYNINTRQQEKVMPMYPERSLVVIGSWIAEHYMSEFGERSNFEVVAAADQPDVDIRKHGLRASRVISNDDPQLKHLLVLVNGSEVQVHNMNESQTMKSFHIENLVPDPYTDPNIIFHGNFIYALPVRSSVVLRFDITSDASEGEQIELPLDPDHRIAITGVHKSLVFGGYRDSPLDRDFVWTFDLDTRQLRGYYDQHTGGNVCTALYCGYLAVVASDHVSFLDYRNDPNKLTVVSSLKVCDSYDVKLHQLKDGRLLLSGRYCGTPALVDFEHVNDMCEILFVEKTTEQTSTRVTINACELVSRAAELLGTTKFVSRYFKMDEQERFGIMYIEEQGTGGKKNAKKSMVRKAIDMALRVKDYIVSYIYGNQQLSLHNIDGIMDIKPEYNTPYMYYKMVSGTAPNDYIRWSMLPPVKQFYGKVIIVYEEFDGTRWKLSKPKHWITEK